MGKKDFRKHSKDLELDKIRLNKTTLKHQLLKIYQEPVTIKDYDDQLRQSIVTGTGRELPMLIIMNDFETPPKGIIETYAHRWLIENNLQKYR